MELKLEQALQKGIEAHKAGKAQEADQYYTAILKANPKHPDANHNIGVLAVGVGKVQEALQFFKTALEANSNIAQYWLSYIDALIKLDRINDAKAVFHQAKSNGAKGDAFDKLEIRLADTVKPIDKIPQTEDPPKDQLKTLASLYTQGKLQEAVKQAKSLTQQFPKSAMLFNIQGAVLHRLQQLDLSKEAYNKAISIKSNYAEAYNNLSNVLREQGELEQAFKALKKAINIKPDYADAYNNIGNVLKEQGKLEKAMDAYAKAISIKPENAEAYNGMGTTLNEQGKLEEATFALNKALEIKPDYAEAYNNMGITLRDQGNLDQAIDAFKKALNIKPDTYQFFNNLGNVYEDQSKKEKALKSYKKAISLNPHNSEAYVNGAEALEKWNQLEELSLWLEKAFNFFENVPSDIKFMKSKLLWRNKNYDEASSLIFDINFKTIPDIRKQDYLQLKAKCFEKLKKFEEAYDCYTKSNLLAKQSHEYSRNSPDKYFKILKNELTKLQSKPLMRTNNKVHEKPIFVPTFLVGFPRSGTTLLDTILRSNSKINVVEEQGMLSAAESFLQKNDFNDFAKELIPPQLILEAQKVYLGELNKHIDTTAVDKVYVDKLPLNLLKAPLLHQLYPDAKFILALRHPMDTILSCWMQNFKLNAPMANMVDLDRIVEFYCVAMETFKLCRSNYNLNVHEVRYEDLINNFQNESEAVVQFLNLKWEPEMEDYRETALKRGRINTPSYSQVVQPIYKDAQYRWLNYQKYLEQYLEQVKPWISEFGYD